MKKSTFRRLLLMLLPIAAVGLATTANSVMIFDSQTGLTTYHSYFELVEMDTFQMAAPTAAVLSLVSGILAAVYLGARKLGCLKAVVWTAFLSAASAAMPILSTGPVKVLPNVLLPIFMLGEALLAYIMVKKPVEAESSDAPRLSRH